MRNEMGYIFKGLYVHFRTFSIREDRLWWTLRLCLTLCAPYTQKPSLQNSRSWQNGENGASSDLLTYIYWAGCVWRTQPRTQSHITLTRADHEHWLCARHVEGCTKRRTHVEWNHDNPELIKVIPIRPSPNTNPNLRKKVYKRAGIFRVYSIWPTQP